MSKTKLGKRERKQYVQIATDLCYSPEVIKALNAAKYDEDATRIMLNARRNGGEYKCLLVN